MKNHFETQDTYSSPYFDPEIESRKKRKLEEREFLKSVSLESFNKREKQFLEDLVGNSHIKSALNQLQTFTSLQQKVDFCNDHEYNLTPEQRLKWELHKKNYNMRPYWELYTSLGAGIVSLNFLIQYSNHFIQGLFGYFLFTRPKTKSVTPEFFLSTIFGGFTYLGTHQYLYYNYKQGVERTFNRVLDLKIDKAKLNDIRRESPTWN